MKTTPLLLALSLACTLFPAQAKEGGDQSSNGMESWGAGVLPPAGDYLLNYTGYWSGDLRDGQGQAADFGGGRHARMNSTFDAFRWVHVTGHKLFGADYAVHVIVPVVNLSVSHPALGGRDSALDVGDIIVSPLTLGWHHGDWHTVAALDVMLPTGRYDQDDPRVSIGANYTAFEPVVAVSWLPRSGWELSAKAMYNIKTENHDTHYQSGDEFHVDWLAGRTLGRWGVGVAGYYLVQTSSDEIDGERVAASPGIWDAGRRGRVFAYGPSVKYSASGATFVAQWLHETDLENRFGGNRVLFKTILPL